MAVTNRTLEANVSTLVEDDFQWVYRDGQSRLPDVVEAYYKHLESANQVIWHSRNLIDYADPDYCPDWLLPHHQFTYLNGFPVGTTASTRMLLKHAKDLYRSKGTERGTALYFQAVYGEEASVYTPSRDLFKLSAGDWTVPQYLEITARTVNPTLTGKVVYGVSSGARAFVERMVKKKTNTKYIDILYISSVFGNFEAGELIQVYGQPVADDMPIILGSLTGLDVIYGSFGFSVGDETSVSSANGNYGEAVVTSIVDDLGTVSFDLVYGGWGYTANVECIVSQSVVRLANLAYAPSNLTFVPLLTTIIEPLDVMTYVGANGFFSNGDNIAVYNSSGGVLGTGRIINTTIVTNSSAGTIMVTPLTGNLQANTTFYNQANAVKANVAPSGFSNVTAMGQVIGMSSNVIVSWSSITGIFQVGETVSQVNNITNLVVASGIISKIFPNYLQLSNAVGLFQSGFRMSGSSSGASANVNDETLDVGVVYSSNNQFVSYNGNFVYETALNTNSSIVRLYGGSGASVNISNVLGFPQSVSLNNQFLSTYANILLNASTYGSGLLANASSPLLVNAITFNTYTIGQITGLTNENPGANYEYAPFVQVIEPLIAPYDKLDIVLRVSNVTGGLFFVGEEVTQPATGASGLVKTSNTTMVRLQRLNFFDLWVANNAGNNYLAEGISSGVTAFVSNVDIDTASNPIGDDAVVTTQVVPGNGSVVTLSVQDSGYGFLDGEQATFVSSDGTRSGTAIVVANSSGFGNGYYRDSNGFLSDTSKLRDGFYYQEYSYEIDTAVSPEVFEQAYKKLMHVSGMALFSKTTKTAILDASISIDSSSITQANSSVVNKLDFVIYGNPLLFYL